MQLIVFLFSKQKQQAAMRLKNTDEERRDAPQVDGRLGAELTSRS